MNTPREIQALKREYVMLTPRMKAHTGAIFEMWIPLTSCRTQAPAGNINSVASSNSPGTAYQAPQNINAPLVAVGK